MPDYDEEHARVLSDLTATAVTRARKAVSLVTQLLEDDDEDTAFVLTFVAADLLNGAAYHLYMSDEDMTEDQALGLVLKSFLQTIGIKNVKAAIMATPVKKESNG